MEEVTHSTLSRSRYVMTREWGITSRVYVIFHNIIWKITNREISVLHRIVISFSFLVVSDIDECSLQTDTCAENITTCFNIEGGYQCNCTDGYRWSGSDKKTCSGNNFLHMYCERLRHMEKQSIFFTYSKGIL